MTKGRRSLASPPSFSFSNEGSGLAIETLFEVRVARLLGLRDRQVEVDAEVATLEVRSDRVATGVRTVRVAAILANQATEIAEALAAAERPEGLLAEQQVLATHLRARIDQGGHHRRGETGVRA